MSNSRDYYLLIYNRFYRGKYDIVLKLMQRKDNEDDTLNSNKLTEEDKTNLDFYG